MKIVIDIPGWRYKSICKGIEASKRCGVVVPDPVIQEAIYKGTPLPKGHGRLIDEKDLSLMTVHMIDGMFVCDAPAIIEADKEEQE